MLNVKALSASYDTNWKVKKKEVWNYLAGEVTQKLG
jgi:hypothetical protein